MHTTTFPIYMAITVCKQIICFAPGGLVTDSMALKMLSNNEKLFQFEIWFLN